MAPVSAHLPVQHSKYVHDFIGGEHFQTRVLYYPIPSGVLDIGRVDLTCVGEHPVGFRVDENLIPPRTHAEACDRLLCLDSNPPPDDNLDETSRAVLGQRKKSVDALPVVFCVASMAAEFPGCFLVWETRSDGPQVICAGTQLISRACWPGAATVTKIKFTYKSLTFLRAVVNGSGRKILVAVGSAVVGMDTNWFQKVLLFFRRFTFQIRGLVEDSGVADANRDVMPEHAY
ncbi:hypothetical protein B0H16DRAFT_1460655 [Mycena metata]|uniref:Uncharacterized protein n=1 Tax=Mycena metata TaxID=1033252 RepID=A0AAD7N9P3_9AGAR|nr:hypothetical protein B0H16DRAFT_1460655 [Mycena metata]